MRPNRIQRRDWTPNRNKLKAAWHFQSLRQDRQITPSMLIQDIPAGLMPWRFVKTDTYNVEIVGDDDHKEQATALLQSLGRYDHQDLRELTASAFEEIAKQLSWYGRAPYEIARAEDDKSIYLLSPFTSHRLFSLQIFYIQLIPKNDRDYWKKSIVLLPWRDVWIVSLPSELGGYRGYRALLRKLSRFGSTGPAFWRKDLGQGKSYPVNFDFSEYRRQLEIFEARVTRRWGWNRRDYSQKNWTEFATFYRTITFKWAQAVLREHILKEFNSLLSRLRIDAELRMTGLPNSAHVLDLRNQMTKGLIGYGAATSAASVS